MRVVARGDTTGRLHAWNPPRSERPVDPAVCSEGFVVPDPAANPGLVGDCETLLGIRDELGGSYSLRWNGLTPISEWVGVILGGMPIRVHELTLRIRGLTGRLPPGLGRLTGLRKMDLSSVGLADPIPAELGALAQLEILDLTGNYLSGDIPPELGNLANLWRLELSWNYLSGSIPPELGALRSLSSLSLNGNSLSGCIAAELPDIWVRETGLERCEPAEVEMP